MEDTYATGTIEIQEKKIPYFGLFDGHGGDLTAKFLANSIQRILQEELSLLGKPLDQASLSEIENILSVVAVKAEQTRRPLYPDDCNSGSTFTMAIIINGAVWAVNAGDSRILALQGDRTIQLTEDATPTVQPFQKGAEKRGGHVSNERVNGILAVARAVGDQFITGITARAKVTRFPLSSDTPTTLIIGCDGLFDVTSSRTIADEYRKTQNVEALIQKAYTSGSGDNISAMVVKIYSNSSPEAH